jgi:hypothetical protein
LTAVPTEEGHYALYEFTNVLPRAKLYSQWEIITNPAAALERIASPAFHPDEAVVVEGGVPVASFLVGHTPNSGQVGFVSYSPKDIVLRSEASDAGVLLLNDHFDPDWHVTVDGKPDHLLRCNYLMRGVYLPAGAHRIEFRFVPPVGSFWVSVVAITTSLLVVGFAAVRSSRRQRSIQVEHPAAPPPETPAIKRPKKARKEHRHLVRKG